MHNHVQMRFGILNVLDMGRAEHAKLLRRWTCLGFVSKAMLDVDVDDREPGDLTGIYVWNMPPRWRPGGWMKVATGEADISLSFCIAWMAWMVCRSLSKMNMNQDGQPNCWL